MTTTWTNTSKSVTTGTVTGSPIGLLLVLTYAVGSGGQPPVWTNTNKS